MVAMPKILPRVIDGPDRVNYVHDQAAQLSGIHVLQAGAITQGEKGQELSDIEGMVKAGIPALSEDGKSAYEFFSVQRSYGNCQRSGYPYLCTL